MDFWINEEHVVVQRKDEDEESMRRLGESGYYQVQAESLGALFRDLRSRFGRCESKVYIDRKDGTTRAIGWVFRRQTTSREAYLEGDPHICQQWVTVLKVAPRTVYEYAEV